MPNGSKNGEGDECLLALDRLKKEASLPTSKMYNLDPLGRSTTSAAGTPSPLPLTRVVIDEAITVRQWVLDLNQAKSQPKCQRLVGPDRGLMIMKKVCLLIRAYKL